ncbi:MAG: NHLP bacteriocin system secretion protein [Deltaproteobacteria bacterium]|uniref:NHLP bacteriocin system secretion protein n=1 Tax=Candidatus Desulfacyla euxinica TaxID=2841693 RepID=A0A8J6MZ50_9DELT|nr:NHLP bacteriocin system secretion protein [Candidatus Desulfacyla euxinica]
MPANPLNTNLFREEALETQSGIRPLEERMQLIAPRWWISVLTILFILCVAALWGWYGRVNTKVYGSGMLVQSGEFRNIVSLSEGIVQILNISEGMRVEEGDILAMLSLPLEELELEHCQARLESLREDVDLLRQLTDQHVKERTAFISRILGDSDEIIKDLDRLLKELIGLNKKYQTFRSRGLVTESETVTVLQNMLNTAVSLIRQRQETVNHKMGKLDYEHVFMREFWQKGREIQEAQQDLALKMAQLIRRKQIVSHSKGVIVNIHKNIGDHMANGEVLCMLQQSAGDTLFVNAVVPATQSKTVEAGQTVHISPSDTEPYRIGYMLGVVEKVGLYPATMGQLINWYENEDLAQTLKGKQAVGTVRIRLVADPKEPTGIKWTGKVPERIHITTGRLCSIQVIVEQRAPVSYVLPYVRKTLLGHTEPHIGPRTEP